MGTLLMGASNAGGVDRNGDSEPESGFTTCCNAAIGQVLPIQQCCTTVPQVVTLIAGSKWQSLLIAGDDDEMFMTRSLNVMPKTTERRRPCQTATCLRDCVFSRDNRPNLFISSLILSRHIFLWHPLRLVSSASVGKILLLEMCKIFCWKYALYY